MKKKQNAPTANVASGGFTAGKWRWKVKTLTDPDAKKVDLNHHVPMTLAQIEALPSPGLSLKDTAKPRGVTPHEFKVIQVSGTVNKLKLEPDGDYHMVVEGPAGKGMNCELPKPEFAAGSIGLPEMKAMRAVVESRIGKGDRPGQIIKLPSPHPQVVVQGVGFWDMQAHGAGEVNGFELHPVLRVEIK